MSSLWIRYERHRYRELGLTKRPEREIFRLSDSFDCIEGDPPVELICEAIKINPNMNNALKKESYVLGGYCIFVEKMRKYREQYTLDEALKKGISECIDEDILRDFFVEYGDEVRKVTVLDFTFEKRIELADYNAEKRGIEIGEKLGIANSIISLLKDLGELPDQLTHKIKEETDADKLKS